jgi:integrase
MAKHLAGFDFGQPPRPRGGGTIVERNGRYGVKVWERGRGAYRWLGTRSTREAAEQLISDALVKSGSTEPTVSDWARIWLSDYSRPSGATRMVYRQAVNRISRELGSLKLAEVDRRTARNHALSWPRNVSAIARTMWGDAVRDSITSENPWTDMRLKQSRGRKDIQALTEEELHALAETAQTVHKDYGQQAAAIILTLGYVGLRPGELCALRNEDLDLANHEMTIRRSLDATGTEKSPKNGKARTVTIPPIALNAIRSLPSMLDGYTFHSYRDKKLSKGNLHYIWRPIKSAWIARGNAPLEMYALRHCAASALAERGVDPATIAIQLGHTDGGALCMKLYCHPSEDRARDRLKMAYATTPQDARMRRSG